jgi:hypothetical protein
VLGGAAVVVLVLVLVSRGAKDKPDASSGRRGRGRERRPRDGIPQQGTQLGDPKSPLVLTEFADLQCPFCKQYTRNVRPGHRALRAH